MNKIEAKKCVRKQLRSLPDVSVRNLMEHAANKTPMIIDYRIRATWVEAGAGCRELPTEDTEDWYMSRGYLLPSMLAARGSAYESRMTIEGLHYQFGREHYFESYEALTEAEVRRLWLAEGRRRGYVI